MRYILLPFQFIRYCLTFPFAVVLSLFCMVFAPLICLFCDKNGYLPKWLKWFEPVDTSHGCYDTLWAASHITWSTYKICWTFIQRNPAYGAMATVFSNVPKKIVTCSIFGNMNVQEKDGVAGFFLIISETGIFQLKIVWHIGKQAIIHEAGWQLKNPDLKTFGSYELAPIRFQLFGK